MSFCGCHVLERSCSCLIVQLHARCLMAVAPCLWLSLPLSNRYLMIGDSVSLGMKQQVFDMLKDKMESYHSPGNADNANVGAHSVRRWLETSPPGTKWDVRSTGASLRLRLLCVR